MNSSVFESLLAITPETVANVEGEGSTKIKEIIIEDLTPEVFKVILKVLFYYRTY